VRFGENNLNSALARVAGIRIISFIKAGKNMLIILEVMIPTLARHLYTAIRETRECPLSHYI
jgi:hypothetical protein